MVAGDAGPAGRLAGVLFCLLALPITPTLNFPQTSRDNITPIPPDRCTSRYEIGPCKSFVHKWHYNSTKKTCHTFIYGGCEGNNNRFDSQDECLYYCVGGEHTLPPHLLTTRATPTTETTTLAATSPPTRRTVTFVPTVPTPPPVPIAERGAELTFEETGHQKVFMFAQSNTFIQLDANRIPTFQLRLCREISFQFRTRLPHGLLVYHSVKNRPENLEPYALYVIVENGQLKVVHVFGKDSTSLTVGRGLNRDSWHTVDVRIDVHGARLIARVDEEETETKLLGLDPASNYGVPTDLPSVVLVGGLSPEEKLHGVKYIIESFVGCIKHMTLSSGKAASDLLPIKPLVATKHENVVEGCGNKCHSRRNLCFVGSHCINHYNRYSCDCFGTDNEGEYCDHNTATMITLRGASHLSYRVYDWKDRVESSENRISLVFKTRYDDSVLFYASGEPFEHHYIAVAIKNKTVHIEIDFGDGAIKTTIGEDVTSNLWTNLTIAHRREVITVHLNDEVKLLDLPGPHFHLFIDPEIYIGGGPDLDKKRELASNNSYAGVLKYVFFNDVSILYELQRANPKVHYIGVLEPEMSDVDVEVLPLTFPFPSSHIWWPTASGASLSLSLGFHSTTPAAALATANVILGSGSRGFWELRVEGDEMRFELTGDADRNETYVTAIKYDYMGAWHTVELKYEDSEVRVTVDYRLAVLSNVTFQLEDNVVVGCGQGSSTGLVGCLRDIVVNGEAVEPRHVLKTERAVGEISMDNCELVDPCKRPNTCEHGGKCSVADEKVICDCKGTGYIGNNCHFAEFRKTCEELALLGYTKPDVYLIDIDGNGRFPPAHVKCEFQSKELEESTKTIVEHNLPSQVDVRGVTEIDFRFNITYREFSAEMLQELISHSLHCSQYIKYDCYKAPLELHSATWFVSSAGKNIVDYVGHVNRGVCPCAVNRSCLEPKQACNCDFSEGKWHSDEGFYVTPESLGITGMVFLQQKELNSDAQGRVTLGPLECVETNTQQYVVTFTSSQSYIEVPGWRKGDISFSFRTTGEKAILLYQPPIRPRHPSFMVALTSDFDLTFNFTLNNGISREMIIRSQRRLNGGEWQKIWIDYNEHHVRFMINTDYQMVDLLPSEEFGPFEGSMFIGGATEGMLRKSSVQQGLIGCFRGLVVNGEILDIYSYMSVHLSEIIKDCKPSCDPNPCKNNAKCKELWSTFQCVCENPWAHVGTYCETNINTNGVMFVRPEAYIRRNYLANVTDEEKLFLTHLMNENILINLRTYDGDSLVLYANDHLNNFVQLHLSQGRWVEFLFNVGPEIHNVTVEYPGLNSGKSIQVAIERTETQTSLHVNERHSSISAPVLMLKSYSNKPWTNPDREVLAPQRPPAPPTEYFQINLGGFDPSNLIAGSSDGPQLCGYVGCIRGLQIGDHLVDLPAQVPYAMNQDKEGVKAGCQMKCDEVPCKNQGICIEDFLKGEITCDCEHTSYYGEFCATEKGADFGGESALQRRYLLDGQVHDVKVQLAFSSNDQRQYRTVLLLLQTENKRSYYLMVALTSEGHLIFEEDREGSAMGAIIKDRHFLNGARHSVYYQRTNNTSVLQIDREEVVLESIPASRMTDIRLGDEGDNEVQVGGVTTSDPRFVAYKSYSGCLSNVFLEVNSYVMKPLDEYMLFTKTGSEKVNVINAAGVRSAQCSFFDVINKPHPGPMLSLSMDLNKAWMEEPPAKLPYMFNHARPSTEENDSTQVIFLVLTTLFVLIVVMGLCLVYRSHLQYKKRQDAETDAAILWQKGQAVKYQEPVITPSMIPMTAYKPLPQQEVKANGTELAPIVKNDFQPSTTTPPAQEAPMANGGAPPDTEKPGPKDSDLLLPQKYEDIPRSLHNSIVEEDEDNVEDDEDEDAEEEKLLDIPSKPGRGDVANGVSTLGGDNNSSALLSSVPGDESKARDSLRAEGVKTRAFMPAILSPVFLSEDQRTFANPISYLGGPRIAYPNMSRLSKESILSLD